VGSFLCIRDSPRVAGAERTPELLALFDALTDSTRELV
jgi:hypothetical protein